MPDTNAYLILAEEAIRRKRRPLSPAQILEVAKKEGFLPAHLHGATMHKTLSARLSEHIRAKSSNSLFYRTAPGVYFSHTAASEADTPENYKKVHLGHKRSKSIRKENVLVARKDILNKEIYGDFIPYNEALFTNIYKDYCTFLDRSTAELDDLVKQFVTFTLVFHETKILIYRRGKFTTTSDTLKGQLSVGFGGHVNDQDFTLFSRGGNAFRANAARELREELYLDDVYSNFGETLDRTELLGYVNVDDSEDAKHHIAVLVAFNHASPQLPKKGELSINQLSWLDLADRKNDLSDFDLWSGIILRNLYDGKIRLPPGKSR